MILVGEVRAGIRALNGWDLTSQVTFISHDSCLFPFLSFVPWRKWEGSFVYKMGYADVEQLLSAPRVEWGNERRAPVNLIPVGLFFWLKKKYLYSVYLPTGWWHVSLKYIGCHEGVCIVLYHVSAQQKIYIFLSLWCLFTLWYPRPCVPILNHT